MIYTLTLSPSLDYYMDVESITYGQVNRAANTRINVGGKGINVSFVLKTLGVENTAVVVTGGFTGNEIKRLLDVGGLNILPIESPENSRINVKLPFCEINAPAPKIDPDVILNVIADLDMQSDENSLLIISGASGMNLKSIRSVWSKRLVFDVSGSSLTDAIFCKPFFIKPNEIELCEYYGCEVTDENIKLCAKKMLEAGAENVAVSMGAAGAMLFLANGEVLSVPAHNIKPVNTVGAGDSFLAGFIAGLMKNNDMQYALTLANASGGAAAASVGLPERGFIEKLLMGQE